MLMPACCMRHAFRCLTDEPAHAPAANVDQDPSDLHDVVIVDPVRRRLILAAMCVALVAVVASVSGLNVAQQALAEDLGASQSQLLWIINGYTLALAALLMPVGAIGTRTWVAMRIAEATTPRRSFIGGVSITTAS